MACGLGSVCIYIHKPELELIAGEQLTQGMVWIDVRWALSVKGSFGDMILYEPYKPTLSSHVFVEAQLA